MPEYTYTITITGSVTARNEEAAHTKVDTISAALGQAKLPKWVGDQEIESEVSEES